MREINKESFEALEGALLACLADMRNHAGLLLAPPSVDANDIENAAVLAISSLYRDYVRPRGVRFIDNLLAGDKGW